MTDGSRPIEKADWIGDVPSHWETVAIKWLTPVKRGASPRPIDDPIYFDDDGEWAWVRIADVSSAGVSGVLRSTSQTLSELGSSLSVKIEPGELFISIAGTVGKPCITSIKCCIHDGFVYFPDLSIDPWWLFRIFEAGECYRGLGKLGTQLNLNTDTIGGIKIPVPPPDEIQQILAYLDRETARIDTLIEEQQRLIEMLRERRRSVAADLLGGRVGDGTRLKWFFNELDCRAGVEADTLPLMSVSISWGVRRRDEVTKDESRAEDLSNYKICREGDLVINRMRAFQGALGLAHEDGLVSPDYAVLRAKTEVDGEWLAAVMKTDAFVSEMSQRVKGIGSTDLGSARTPRINIGDLGEIRIDLPEIDQQVVEARQRSTQITKADTLIAETERFIELARERRTALITAAVTGQIDVREMG